ncbi:MAG TPA: hypothetical protein PKH07_04830 [bacterium]|nr:hypothetical protein [bacterium]
MKRLLELRLTAIWILVALSLTGCVRGAKKVPVLPHEDLFTKHVLNVVESYPTDGTHKYWWPKDEVWAGVTRDIRYKREVVAKGDPQGRCYCCGLTWEVFMRAVEQYNKRHWRNVLDHWTREEVDDFRKKWFGSDGNKECLRNAILSYKIGREITNKDEARRGDFVQLWRANGSGHSVVFDSWIRSETGEIGGMKYWSTQPASSGIGYATETTKGPKALLLDQTYVMRIGKRR